MNNLTIKNLKCIEAIKRGEQVNENYEKLYKQNYGFMFSYLQRYFHTPDSVDDLTQLAYFALVKAVKYHKSTTQSFLALYKVNLNNYWYRYNREMNSVCKLSQLDLSKNPSTTQQAPIELNLDVLSEATTTFDETVEYRLLQDLLWTEISRTLTQKNAYILVQKYVHNKSLAQIGRELHIGRERVRKRELRSLNKLKSNKVIKEIAYDFFGIK